MCGRKKNWLLSTKKNGNMLLTQNRMPLVKGTLIKIFLTNYQDAVKWYTVAAEQEDAEAQYELAMLYDPGYSGSKIPQSLQEPDHILYNKALPWYLKASAQNNERASDHAAAIYKDGKHRINY